MQRKYGEIQETSKNAKREADENLKKIQNLRNQLIEKDRLLDKIAKKLIIYQEKVSNLEERLFKFVVRRPGAQDHVSLFIFIYKQKKFNLEIIF